MSLLSHKTFDWLYDWCHKSACHFSEGYMNYTCICDCDFFKIMYGDTYWQQACSSECLTYVVFAHANSITS